MPFRGVLLMPKLVLDAVDEFMDEIVAPTVKEFFSELDNIRRAKLACITVSSLGDYFVHERLNLCSLAVQTEKDERQRVTKHLKDWSNQCSDFGLVRDIGDATKHMKLTRETAKITRASSVQQDNVFLVLPDGSVLVLPDEDGGHSPLVLPTEVWATDEGGKQYPVLGLVEKAVLFLQERMGRTPAWPLP